MPKERGGQKPIESPFTGGIKMPPQNIEAEISTLGALMLDSNAVIRVVDILRPEHFYRPQHQTIYGVVVTFLNAISLLTCFRFLRALGKKVFWREWAEQATLRIW